MPPVCNCSITFAAQLETGRKLMLVKTLDVTCAHRLGRLLLYMGMLGVPFSATVSNSQAAVVALLAP